MNELKVSIKLNTWDLRYFVGNNFLHNYPIYLLLFACLFLFFQVLEKQYPNNDKVISFLLASAGIIILWLGLGILFQLISKISQTQKFLDEKTYTFSEKNISITWREQSYDVSWKDLNRITENRYYYYFHLNASQALIIPKRFLNTADKKFLHHIIKKFNKKRSRFEIKT